MISTAPTSAPPAAAAPLAPVRPPFRRLLRQSAVAYLYLLPAAAILIVFHLFPIIYAFYMSLFRWRLVQGPFIGLDNYVNALTTPDFWESLVITLFYAAGTIPVNLTLAFLISYVLFRKVRVKDAYRMIFFMPHITSAVAAALIWRWIFHAQYGILNMMMDFIGLPHQQWLLEPRGILQLALAPLGFAVPDWAGGPSLALCSIMIYAVWQSLGFAIVIMLAGLTSISPDVYDAARIDGAGEWRILRHITLPLLSPTLFFLSIVSVIGAFQTFNSIYVMTDPQHGGPLNTTRNVPMLIFLNFYEFNKLGLASAIAFLLFFIILALTIVQMRILGQRVHYQN